MYLDAARPGVEDLLDRDRRRAAQLLTYAGARTLEEFHERAVVGVQSAAGYAEGKPLLRLLVKLSANGSTVRPWTC